MPFGHECFNVALLKQISYLWFLGQPLVCNQEGFLLWEIATVPKLAILSVCLYPPQQILQQEQGDLIWGKQHWVKINSAIIKARFYVGLFLWRKKWRRSREKKWFFFSNDLLHLKKGQKPSLEEICLCRSSLIKIQDDSSSSSHCISH